MCMNEPAIYKRTGRHYAVDFLAWHDGVDALLKPSPDSPMPNVLIHTARMVCTPMGICQAGMILINPANKAVPDFFGFVAEDLDIGRYFGPRIFKGTPFENAPVHLARMQFDIDFPGQVACTVEAAGHVIELSLGEFDEARFCHRPPAMPFTQNVVEARARKAVFTFDGRVIPGTLPPDGLAGGLPACYAPTGLYTV
ncbi:MAG: hypothetical protein GX448_06485 [Planctomycetes bacterium]|nr:hypothetical protein [Planctomycetota bacterium]